MAGGVVHPGYWNCRSTYLTPKVSKAVQLWRGPRSRPRSYLKHRFRGPRLKGPTTTHARARRAMCHEVPHASSGLRPSSWRSLSVPGHAFGACPACSIACLTPRPPFARRRGARPSARKRPAAPLPQLRPMAALDLVRTLEPWGCLCGVLPPLVDATTMGQDTGPMSPLSNLLASRTLDSPTLDRGGEAKDRNPNPQRLEHAEFGTASRGGAGSAGSHLSRDGVHRADKKIALPSPLSPVLASLLLAPKLLDRGPAFWTIAERDFEPLPLS